jgi:hypothetical protein
MGCDMSDLKKLAEVRRYSRAWDDYGASMEESENGDYVLYSDYAALQKEVETLRTQAAKARQEALEEAAKVCARIRHNNNLIWRGTTIADPDHEMAKYRSDGADACEYAIRALQQHTGEVPDNG